jgi:hypothetical protein
MHAVPQACRLPVVQQQRWWQLQWLALWLCGEGDGESAHHTLAAATGSSRPSRGVREKEQEEEGQAQAAPEVT